MWAIILVFIVIAIFRVIGIENIPFKITTIIMISALILAIFSVIRYKGNKKEHAYLIVMTLQLVIFVGTLIIGVILQNNYPSLSDKYKPIITTLIVIIFISLVVTACLNAIIKFKKYRK